MKEDVFVVVVECLNGNYSKIWQNLTNKLTNQLN